jgi:hypothetical protein
MTALTDAKALAPNAAAKAAVSAKSVDYVSMLNLIIQLTTELRAHIALMVALHPASGDGATLTALNNILSELA